MFGLGKPRTKFGLWIDRKKLSQEWVIDNVGLNRKTVYKLCNDKGYGPNNDTQIKIISKLRKNGFDVEMADFW